MYSIIIAIVGIGLLVYVIRCSFKISKYKKTYKESRRLEYKKRSPKNPYLVIDRGFMCGLVLCICFFVSYRFRDFM